MIRGVSLIVVAGPSPLEFAVVVPLETAAQVSDDTHQLCEVFGSITVQVGARIESTTATPTSFAVPFDAAKLRDGGSRVRPLRLAVTADR